MQVLKKSKEGHKILKKSPNFIWRQILAKFKNKVGYYFKFCGPASQNIWTKQKYLLMWFQKIIHPIVYCKRILTDRHIDHRYYTWRYFVVTGQAEHLKVKIDLHLKGCANTSYFVPLRNALFSLPVMKWKKWTVWPELSFPQFSCAEFSCDNWA